MTTIYDLFDREALARALNERLVVARQHPTHPLTILNYTERCQYERGLWTDVTRTCRGLIHDASVTNGLPRTADVSQGGSAQGSSTAAPAPRVGRLFKGTVGDAKVEMDLKRDGEALSGSYYYLKSGSSNRLTLKGRIGADGRTARHDTKANASFMTSSDPV